MAHQLQHHHGQVNAETYLPAQGPPVSQNGSIKRIMRTIDIPVGGTFADAARHALETVRSEKEPGQFEFNGITVPVYLSSTEMETILIYSYEHKIRRLKAGYQD